MALPKIDELIKQWKKSHSDALRALILALDEAKPLAELQGLETLKIAQVVERLEPFAKAGRANDPRLTHALEPILANVTWSSDGSKPAWRAIFAAVTASGDARFRELNPQFKVRPLMQEWLLSAWKKTIAELPEKTLPRDDDAKWKAALDALPKKKAAPGAKDEAALLADVFARPDDDGPRLVYADFLQERGDPRGEFITLQCGARDEKREKALLKQHEKKWLGALAPVLSKGVEFRRGFPSKGRVNFRAQTDAEKYGVLPEWATFEELEWINAAASSDQRRWTRFIGPNFRNLKVARSPHFTTMLDAKTPWAVEYLAVIVSEPDDLKRFASVAKTLFPKLRTLRILWGLNPGWLTGVPSLGNVTRLELGGSSDVGPMLGPVSATDVKELWFEDVLRFSRDASGKFSVLDFHIDEERTDQRYFLGHALRLPHGYITSFTFGGARKPDNPKVEETLRERVRAKDGADPFAPKKVGELPEIKGWPPMTWLDGTHLLISMQGVALVVDAPKQRVVREFPIDRLLAVRRYEQGKSFLGLQNNAIVCVDADTGTTKFEVTTPWHSSYRLNVSADGKRASSAKGVLIDLEAKQLVPPPRGAREASYRALDDSFWLQWVPAKEQGKPQPYILRRPGVRESVDLERGQGFEGPLEAGGGLIARTSEELLRWDRTTGAVTHSVKMKNELRPPVHLHATEDGSRLAVAETPKRALVLDATDLKVLAAFDVDTNLGGLALSPDGKKLAAIVGAALRVFTIV
ncbi:MAG: TIGR02996 domain-containing protein [Archangium sp.]|nr:TIGR02996 domain-containing protein [Archangium sp.]